MARVETPSQREERIERLEQDRARRRGALPTVENDPSVPMEIAPQRGDLNRTSQPWFGPELLVNPDLFLFGNTNVSYSNLFQTQPWVAAAVMRLLTWGIRVPLKVYERTGDDSRIRLREQDHPLAEAVVNPWDRAGTAHLVMNLLGPMLVHGQSLTEVLSGNRNKIQFSPKDWRFCAPIRPWRDSLEGFKVDADQPDIARDVSIDDLLHIAWWSPAGPLGTSPLQQLGVTLRIESAAQRYQQSIFKNSARPPSAVSAAVEFLGLDREERDALMKQLRADIDFLFAGPENAGRPPLLPPGLTWDSIGHTSVEAELIDQRKIARDEVAAVYMIPPPMMGILDKATFSNIETQREMIYTESVGPPLLLVEQSLNAQLVRSMLGEQDIYVEFDFAGVLRGDRLKEIQALREAIGMALLTPNEGRAKLNEPRSDAPGMDDFYLPVNNLAPVGSSPQAPGPPPTRGASLLVKSRDRDYEKVLT